MKNAWLHPFLKYQLNHIEICHVSPIWEWQREDLLNTVRVRKDVGKQNSHKPVWWMCVVSSLQRAPCQYLSELIIHMVSLDSEIPLREVYLRINSQAPTEHCL